MILRKLHILHNYSPSSIKDAAGIVTSGPKGRLYQCKGNGMVNDVFEQSKLTGLVGSLGIGHGNDS